MKLKKIILPIVILSGLLIAAVMLSALIWPPINDVRTGETPEYPALQPAFFKSSYYQVFDAALATAREMGWGEITEDRGNGIIYAVATTTVLRFQDDVTITIKPAGDGIEVNVRSHSRVGKGDFGANARRIHRFLTEMKKRL